MESKSLSLKKRLLVTIISASIAALIGTFVARAMQPSLESEIVQLCDQINKQCPMNIDAETRLDALAPGLGKAFSYNYTLKNQEKATVDVEKLKAVMTPLVVNRAKSSDEMKTIFAKGITVSYRYSDKNGIFLFTIPVTP